MKGNKKIAFNSIIIYIKLCVVSLISIVLSRYVLDALGASDYGLYSVVGGIVLLLNVINSAMTSSTYRYLAFEIGKEENGDAHKIFNISFVIHLGFALAILVLGGIIGEFYISNYLNISSTKIPDAKFIFRLSILAAAFNTITVPYQGLLVAYEKFTITAAIDIFSNVVKLLLVLLFIFSEGNRLRIYGCIMLSYTIVSCVTYYVYCKYKFKSITRFKYFKDGGLYQEMVSFSGWTLFGAAANVGKAQGSAIIINLFFGTVVNAAYAIAHQVETFIMMFARSLSSAAVPQTTKNYSAGNLDRSIILTSYISKYTFILMALVSIPIMLEIDFLLDIWLKEVPAGAASFCNLIILGNLIGCLGEGIPNLINASGKIKAYQIVVNSILFAGLPISFFLYKAGMNVYTICIVYCVINFVNSFVKLYMLKRVVSFNVYDFIKVSHLRIAIMAIPLCVYYYLYHPGTTILSHILGILLTILVILITVLLCGLDASEKEKLKNLVKWEASHYSIQD